MNVLFAVCEDLGPLGRILYAFDPSDGTVIAKGNPPFSVTASTSNVPAAVRASDGHLFLGSQNGTVEEFDTILDPDWADELLMARVQLFGVLATTDPALGALHPTNANWTLTGIQFQAGACWLFWKGSSGAVTGDVAIQLRDPATFVLTTQYLIDSARLPCSTGNRCYGLNAAGTIAFLQSTGNGGIDQNKIYSYTLATDTIADWGSYGAFTPNTGVIVREFRVLSDDRIVALYHNASASANVSRIVLFDTDGTILNDFAPEDDSNKPQHFGVSTDELSVWTAQDTGASLATFRKYTLTTGTKTADFETANENSEGFIFEGEFDADVPDPEPEPDPIPDPTPAAPLTPCTPETTLTGGGKGASGCNDGGVGFTPTPIYEYGEVPQHDDPPDGETLTGKDHSTLEVWADIVHTDYPSGDTTTYMRAGVELADDPSHEGGRKVDGLLSVGVVENALGNEQGSFEAATCDIELSDIRDRFLRQLMADQELDGDEVTIKAETDEGRALGVPPRILFRGIVQQAQLTDGLRGRLSLIDWLFSDFGPYGPDRKWPPLFGDLGLAAPDMTPDISTQAMPSLFGEKSDEGAIDPITNHPHSKGLLPVYMVGWFTVDGIRMGFLALGIGEWFGVVGGYGSDLGEGVEGQTPDRMQFDLATRGDLFVPEWHWPADQVLTPYVSIVGNIVRFTNPETGKVYDLFGVFATGAVLSDHLHGVVNFAFNAIGRMDAEGRPVMHSARVQQYWLENDVLREWTSGDLVSEDDFPAFDNGIAKVRSSSFTAMQAIYDALLGEPAVLSWYQDKQESTLEIVRQMNQASESRIGVNAHGQLMLWGLNLLSDPSTWPRIDHVTDVFGPIVRTSGVERENVVQGSCDWDPDKDRFRVNRMTLESAEAIEQYKNRRKVGPLIESQFYSQPIGLFWVLTQRLARLKHGMTMLDVPGPRAWLDRGVGDGILFNSEDGPGPAGYVDQPCVIMRRRTDPATMLVTDTLWDVGGRLVATRVPGGLARLFLATDDTGDAPIATDNEDLAPIAM